MFYHQQMQSVVCTSIASMFQQAVACCVPRRRERSFCVFWDSTYAKPLSPWPRLCGTPCNTAAHMPDHLLKCLHEHLTLSPVECATAHAETQALDHLGNRTCNKRKEYIQKCDPPGPSVCFLWKGLQKVSTGQTPHSSRRCPKVSSWWDRRRNHMFFNLVSKRLQ